MSFHLIFKKNIILFYSLRFIKKIYTFGTNLLRFKYAKGVSKLF